MDPDRTPTERRPQECFKLLFTIALICWEEKRPSILEHRRLLLFILLLSLPDLLLFFTYRSFGPQKPCVAACISRSRGLGRGIWDCIEQSLRRLPGQMVFSVSMILFSSCDKGEQGTRGETWRGQTLGGQRFRSSNDNTTLAQRMAMQRGDVWQSIYLKLTDGKKSKD
jgi:hypothetical protein